MQENETPIEDETTDTPTAEPPVEPLETIGFVDVKQDTDTDESLVESSTADVIPTQAPMPGKYDAVYNPEAHSRRSANTRHKAKKVERLFTRGEQMMIKGTLFKVTAVGHKTMTLQLLPQPKETETSGTES
jgi:hypothetical protein